MAAVAGTRMPLLLLRLPIVRCFHSPATASFSAATWLDADLSLTVQKGKLRTGLRALDLREGWILTPPKAHDLQLKEEILQSSRRDEVLQSSDPATFAGQREVLELLLPYLLERFPEHYRLEGEQITVNAGAGYDRRFHLEEAAADAPLELCARLVPEDFVLMRRPAEEGGSYEIVAAAVVFSFGNMMQRVGERHNLKALHEKVGNFERDLLRPVDRVFSSMKADRPMWRANWSITFSPSLVLDPERYLLNDDKRRRYFPETWDKMPSGADEILGRFATRGVGETAFLKTEYQTLRRLPTNTEYVLFTVHTLLDSLSTLAKAPRAAANLAGQVGSVAEMDFRHYKGLSDEKIRNEIVSYLESLSAS